MFEPCPVILEAQKVLNLSGNLARSMRRLRSKLNHCKQCERYGTCTDILVLQDQINTAIQELTEEWNLVP